MKIKKILIYSFTIVTVFVVISYLVFLFVFPIILNSKFSVRFYEDFLSKKIDSSVQIKSFEFRSKPDISFEVIIKSISANNPKGIGVFSVKDFSFVSKPFSFKPKSIAAKTIYVNYPYITGIFPKRDSSATSSFNIEDFPRIDVGKIYIDFGNLSNLELLNIKTSYSGGQLLYNFHGKLKIPYINAPVILRSDNNIIYYHGLYFDKFLVKFNSSKIYISGPLNKLSFKGYKLPVNELETSFLHFYKLRHPNKKNFIENFQNFSGLMDIDLVLKNGSLTGICTANNLQALFSQYKIPVLLPKVQFYFSGGKIYAVTSGYFGSEPVQTDFYLEGLFTKNVVVRGNVHSKLTNKFSKKYFPMIKISGSADAVVKYFTKSGNVGVKYILTVKKGDNLLSTYGNLDNVDRDRQIVVQTNKQADKIYIKEYRYQFLNGKNKNILLYGNGLFEKLSGHYSPVYITLKTQSRAPISIFESFTKNFIHGGVFSSDLKYEFLTKTLSGYVKVYNVAHSDFLFLENTDIKISNNRLKLISDGTFFDSPIRISMTADNNFRNNILIHDIDIHLDKFFIKKGNYTSFPAKTLNSATVQNKKEYKVVVERGRIHVNDILHTKFSLHDVEILGMLKNNIVDFVIPETNYAKGILSAKGCYNIKNHSSDIKFFASDIDSNEVVTHIFNLPNQVHGLAFATLHLKTKNKLNDIKAHATFAINEGFLPKLGSTEFIVKKSRKIKFINIDKIKFTLSKITNIDFSNKKVLASNIYGSFILDNSDVNKIKIFSQSDYLSLFIEGHYNIDTQFSHLCIWGRHNKTEEKKIRILKLPFTFLYRLIFRIERTKEYYQCKVSMIPPIKLKSGDIESIFRVIVKGNLNSDNLKVILKDLR